MGLQSVINGWLPLSRFPGRVPGEQARDFDQRGGGRTARFRGFCVRLSHFDPAPSPSGGEGRNGQIESIFFGRAKPLGYGSAMPLKSS